MGCDFLMIGIGAELHKFQIDLAYGCALSKSREKEVGDFPGTYRGYFPIGSIGISYDF